MDFVLTPEMAINPKQELLRVGLVKFSWLYDSKEALPKKRVDL
jgi:hypothetical protein